MTRRLVAVLAVFATLAGCSSDGTANPDPSIPLSVHSMAVQAGGYQWTTSTLRATYFPSTGTVLVAATDSVHSPTTTISLYVDAAKLSGSYALPTSSSLIVEYVRNDSTWTTTLGRLGSITLTTVNATRLTGTFNVRMNHDPALTADDSSMVLVAKGSFDITLP